MWLLEIHLGEVLFDFCLEYKVRLLKIHFVGILSDPRSFVCSRRRLTVSGSNYIGLTGGN